MGKTVSIMNTKTIDMSPIAVKYGAAAAASMAFLLGATFAIAGDTTQAITDFGMTLFFLFAYHNPELVTVKRLSEFEDLIPYVDQKKFLWASLGIGLFAVVWEFKSLLGY
jgi:hypothetical protein